MSERACPARRVRHTARLSVALAADTPNRHDGPIQFKRMECKEKQRLTEEYFDAFKRQQWISQRLKSIRADADSQLISVGEKQTEAPRKSATTPGKP